MEAFFLNQGGPGFGAILSLRNGVGVCVFKMYFNLFVSFKDSVSPNTKAVYTQAHAHRAHTTAKI